MAQGNNEHRMVFDIRGRRRHVVKFVYALLAILMAGSLFLVTGAVNLNSIFGGSSSGESAAQVAEKQAVAIEQRIAKEPAKEEVLLGNLTRARITVANAMALLAAAWPIASPSAKLCSPMPTAMSSESWRAGDQVVIPRARAGRSVTAIAPGPLGPVLRPTRAMKRS